MKASRSVSAVAIALLVVATLAMGAMRAHAQGPRVQPTAVVDTGKGTRAQPAPGDSDAIQDEKGGQVSEELPGGAEVATAEDAGAEQQEPAYKGSISVNDNTAAAQSEADEAASLQAMAKVSADQASVAALAANPGTAVIKVELDNENGSLVYGVTLSNGTDVKVDAGTATILHADAADAGENNAE